MKKYLITYDLKQRPITVYENLYVQIKNIGSWWHYLESIWIVKSDLGAVEISRKLIPHINLKDDRLFVVEIETINSQGWLPKEAWDWLNS